MIDFINGSLRGVASFKFGRKITVIVLPLSMSSMSSTSDTRRGREKRTHTHTKSLTNPFPNDKYLAESAELLIADDYSSL